jgi:hypothetical protein
MWDYRTIGLSDYRDLGLSDYRDVGLSDYRTIGLSDYRTIGMWDYRTIGMWDVGAVTALSSSMHTLLPITAMAESNAEDSADELTHTNMQKYQSHPRLIVDNEGNLDISILPRTNGYVYKKGGAVNARGGFRNWKKRWFVLAPVDFLGHEGYELQYYDAPNGTLKGNVSLSDVELYCENFSTNKKVKNEFQIKLQTGGVLQLSCDNEAEREEWLETLSLVVMYMQKITTDSAMTLDGYDPAYEDDEDVYKIGEELAQNCQAIGPGLFGAEAGQSTSFLVQVHDLLGLYYCVFCYHALYI